MNKILVGTYGILFLMMLFLYWLLFVKPVGATNNNFSLCHHTPGNEVTINYNNLQSFLNHKGQPHSGQTYDTDGACSSPTPTPTSSPSAIPSITPEPSVSSPSATPRTESGAGTSAQYNPNNDPAPIVCHEIKFTPTIHEVSRNNPTSIHAKWSKVDEFVTHYKIEYGLENGVVLWNTIVEGNESDLNYLPFNHILWLRVAGTENGCVGNFSEWIDP